MSTAATLDPVPSADDLLAMGDAARGLERWNGEVRERTVSYLSGATASIFAYWLVDYLRRGALGDVFGADVQLRIFPSRPGEYVFADCGVLLKERWPGGHRPDSGFLSLAPDVVVEVVSPGNSAEELEEKVREYLRAGVRLVWVAYPRPRRVYAYHPDGTAVVYGLGTNLPGEDVLPGFSVPVDQLFPADDAQAGPLPAPGTRS